MTRLETLHSATARYRAFIFDLDGTLIDSAPGIAAALDEYFVAQGWPRLAAGYVASFTGKGSRHLIADILLDQGLPADDATIDQALDGYMAAYRRSPSRGTHLYDFVDQDLHALADRGYRLGVCTNKETDLSVRILEALQVRSLFDVVAGPDSVPVSKPSPVHLWTVAERMGLPSDSFAYIGDTTIDQATATAARVPFYAVPWGTGAQLAVAPPFRLTRLVDLVPRERLASVGTGGR